MFIYWLIITGCWVNVVVMTELPWNVYFTRPLEEALPRSTLSLRSAVLDLVHRTFATWWRCLPGHAAPAVPDQMSPCGYVGFNASRLHVLHRPERAGDPWFVLQSLKDLTFVQFELFAVYVGCRPVYVRGAMSQFRMTII